MIASVPAEKTRLHPESDLRLTYRSAQAASAHFGTRSWRRRCPPWRSHRVAGPSDPASVVALFAASSIGVVMPLADAGEEDPWPRHVDPAGRALGPLSRGEVALAGPTVARGYDNDPAATRKFFVDGWFRAGDLGYLDARGFLTLA